MPSFSSRRKLLIVARWALLALLALGQLAAGPAARRAAPRDTFVVHLPLVLRSAEPIIGINGTVQAGGALLTNAPLRLDRLNTCNGTGAMIGSTNSTADGTYAFGNLASLQPCEQYIVTYLGSGPSHLLFWSPTPITSYSAGSVVQLAPFDVAGVPLLDPADGAHVTLPYTFKWGTRPATPQDHYTIKFKDAAEFDSGDLGYTDHYTLSALPPGAPFANSSYFWIVAVNWPDGSGGEQWLHYVFFNNSDLQARLAGPLADLR